MQPSAEQGIDVTMMKQIIRFDIDAIQSPNSPDLLIWKTKLLELLQAGHPVALIGTCRTGKTLLLSAMIPNIIDKSSEAMRASRWQGHPLDLSEIPEGVFGIDECQLIKPQSLEHILPVMAEQGRAFVLCCQRFGSIENAINAYRAHENSQALVIVVMGGHRNPQTILDELPK